MLKIVTYGAESTGKTWLAKALADHYQTEWVPEFAREFLQEKHDKSGEICSFQDLMPIALGQIRAEEKAMEKTNSDLIICDTNPLQTYYYGKAYFNNFEHPELWELAIHRKYDFYFLTYIDIPWEEDDLRDKPEEREEMHELFLESLQKNNLPFMLLKGNKEERLNRAINKIEELKRTNLKKFES